MKKILILASNPQGTHQLRLDNEIRAIEDAFRSGEKRERFTVVSRVAVRISDLQSFLRREKPRLVHFCGHGTGSQGLVLTAESGEQQQTVGTKALADLFRLFATRVECVVLNACYSKVQGEAINQHINYVIGTKRAILDKAAIAFAKGFYEALSDGESIESSYKYGCNRIQLDIKTNSTSDRKLVPIISEFDQKRIEVEEHKVLTLLTKKKLNKIFEYIPDRETSSLAQNTNRASKGIDILAGLMKNSFIKNAVIGFKTEFQAISDQVEIMSIYKELHDILHDLEFKCYQGILREARDFPDDYDEYLLENCGEELKDIIANVESIVAQKNPASEGIDWQQKLDRAGEFLLTAIEKKDKSKLKQTISAIRRVINTEPSQINRALVSIARVLRLPILIKAMSNILNMIVDSQLETTKINQFQDSVISLSELNDNLKLLITSHDNWQRIDIELRRIENVNKYTSDLSELETSWQDLRVQVEKEYQDSQESWAISLGIEAVHLDEAISTQNTPEINKYFRKYCNLVRKHFFEVDKQLNDLCGNLREVGKPLAFLLEMME